MSHIQKFVVVAAVVVSDDRHKKVVTGSQICDAHKGNQHRLIDSKVSCLTIV